MNTIRAFFAIIPPKEFSNHLLSLLEALKQEVSKDDVRWINLENLHITLQFIGQLQLEHLVALSEIVRAELEHIPSFQLKFGSLKWFPNASHPKVLSLECEPQEVLAHLAKTIAQSMNVFHYPIESRPFRSHMSIGRICHKKEKISLSQVKLAVLPPAFIDSIFLIESKIGHEKVTYTPLAQFKLA